MEQALAQLHLHSPSQNRKASTSTLSSHYNRNVNNLCRSFVLRSVGGAVKARLCTCCAIIKNNCDLLYRKVPLANPQRAVDKWSVGRWLNKMKKWRRKQHCVCLWISYKKTRWCGKSSSAAQSKRFTLRIRLCHWSACYVPQWTYSSRLVSRTYHCSHDKKGMERYRRRRKNVPISHSFIILSIYLSFYYLLETFIAINIFE